jgi:lysophospholipase L1-like esterase
MIFKIALVLTLLLSLYWLYNKIVQNIMKPPPNYPDATKILPNKKIVVCAGDSITHGNMSYDWVKALSEQLPDYQFFNAGINSDLSYTLRSRLEDIIAVQPHHINILIGTNDIVAQSRPLKKSDRYFQFKKIEWGTQPTLESYLDNMQHILSRLKTETKATISIMSIPIIGEDVNSTIFKTVENYNLELKKLADTEGVIHLPLQETMRDYLLKNDVKSPIPYEKTQAYITNAAYLKVFLRWDLDKITAYRQQLLTFDNLHFNSVGGKMIENLLLRLLKA